MMAEKTLHIYSNVLSYTLKCSPYKDSTSKIHRAWKGRMYLHFSCVLACNITKLAMYC